MLNSSISCRHAATAADESIGVAVVKAGGASAAAELMKGAVVAENDADSPNVDSGFLRLGGCGDDDNEDGNDAGFRSFCLDRAVT